MEEDTNQDTDPDIQAQLILLAASHHNLESLHTLLRTGSASVQDTETGFTPLHAAIAACNVYSDDSPEYHNDLPNGQTNGVPDSDHNKPDVEAAAKTLRLLLQNGAIWNDVDQKNETPGCLALRLGLKELYEIMVDAGVRAEMLLSRLDEYEQLADSEEDAEEDIVVDGVNQIDEEDSEAAAGREVIDRNAETKFSEQPPTTATPEADLHNEVFLQSSLRVQDGCILDASNNAVMMAWETPIMKRTVDLLCPRSDLRILNIGHGMGIIDTLFQEKKTCQHHIIEAHAAIIHRMQRDGWDQKQNVTVHEGRWQDVVPKLMEQGIMFDAIYFDTFAEDYKALRDFFSDCVIGLLDDGGNWGFFNGLGADRQICYDVYGKVVEMDLFEAGFDTTWETIEVAKMENEEWDGVKRPYWALKEYRLPVCEFIG